MAALGFGDLRGPADRAPGGEGKRVMVKQHQDALAVPAGFVRVEFCGHSVCGLDGAVEQPVLVVQFEPDQPLWQACTRYDCFGRRRDDRRYQPGMPYWHPLTAVGDNDAASMTADAAPNGVGNGLR